MALGVTPPKVAIFANLSATAAGLAESAQLPSLKIALSVLSGALGRTASGRNFTGDVAQVSKTG